MNLDTHRAPLRDFPPQTFTLLQHLVNSCPAPFAMHYEAVQHWAKHAIGNYDVLSSSGNGRSVLALLESGSVVAYVDITRAGHPYVQIVSRKGLWDLMQSLQRSMLHLWMGQLDAKRETQRVKLASSSMPDLGFRSVTGKPLSLRSYSGSWTTSRIIFDAHRFPMYRYDASKAEPVARITAFMQVSEDQVTAQMQNGTFENLEPRQVFSVDCAICELPLDVDVVALLTAYCGKGPYYKVLLAEALDSTSECQYRVTAAQFDPAVGMHYRFVSMFVANPEALCILKDQMGKEQAGRVDSKTAPLINMLQPVMTFWS